MRIMWAVRTDICPVGNILDRSDCVTAVVYLVRNRRKTSRFSAGIRAVIGRFSRVQPVSDTNRGGPSARYNETVSGAPLGRSMVSPSSRPL